jgi:hypothetical protein
MRLQLYSLYYSKDEFFPRPTDKVTSYVVSADDQVMPKHAGIKPQNERLKPQTFWVFCISVCSPLATFPV